MGSLYLWGRSIQEIGGDIVIGRSIYGVVIDGSLYSRLIIVLIYLLVVALQNCLVLSGLDI